MNHHVQTMESVSDVLWKRCTSMGLSAWLFDRAGAVLHKPEGYGTDRDAGALVSGLARETLRRSAAGADMPPTPIDGIGTVLALNAGDGVVLAVAPTGESTLTRPLHDGLIWMRNDLVENDRSRSLLKNFSTKLIQSYEETYTLFRVMRLLASSAAPVQQIHMVCRNVQQTLPFRWVAVAFRDDERVIPELRGALLSEGEVGCPQAEFDRMVRTLAFEAEQDGWTKVLNPADHELPARLHAEVVCDPVTYDGAVIGLLLAGNKLGTDADVASPEMQFVDAVADFLGTFHENIARFAEQRAMSLGTLHALSASIDAKDRYTRGHSERVAFLAHAIALEMGIGSDHAERVRIAGLVHDIGKIGVPESILGKAGKLTDEEFAAIKRHPEIGHNILRDIVLLEDTLPGVLHHHERWDGRGYPHGLRGDQIPMIARMIGLADSFDAMSSSRSYRPALPRQFVLTEIARCAGSQFDPRVVEAFSRVDLSGYDSLLERQAASEAPLMRAAA